nr:putative ribonuclease H-like domain-containing protein [Tanacetum cinerariifolium]
MAQPTARNHAQRGNHKQYAKMTLSNPQRHVVPTAVLTQSKLVPITVVKPVATVVPKPTVTRPRQAKTVVTKPNSPPRRHINHSPSPKASNFPPKVSAVKAPIVNAAKRNMTYLSDFEELNGRYVAFSGNPNGGKISRNGKIKTGNACLVLPPDFKLPDENQVLLRVLRENNMYNVNLKNIVPSGDLTCLFAKATLDESNLWHRRLGYINFKTINKLVKGNLVRGLPSKVFKNDHFCVACKKGKQHKASCKTKPNRALVTKPQHKTPYELLHGRTPSIGFMRPFGYLVTILNTLESLGKFDGKVAEGFLVGYYGSSLQPQTGQSRPNRSTLLYERSPIIGNQFNHSAGVQEQFDAKKAREESDQQYVLFPVWSSNSTNPQNTDGEVAFDEKEPEFEGRKPESEVNVSPSSSAQTKKHDNKTKREAKGKILTVGQLSPNNTNTFSAAGPSNAAASPTHGKSSYVDSSQLLDDPNMPELEDITYSDYEDDVGAEADFNNLETTITVSPIPTTRVHKDHHVTQIIGDLSSATQTRSMTRVAKDQGGLSQINNDDFYTCMFACFLSQEEPKGAIGTKWVFRNKKDERDIVVKNKARLVAQGHTQEEWIDYEEVFALVARIEAIRLFLAYASFIGFMVYQMDVKSAFLYETIEEEVYVYQPLGFEDPDNPDKRGKIDQTLFIKRHKGDILLVQIYVDDIIFGSTNKDLCKAFEKLIKDKFQMSSMGELTFLLGLQVKQKKYRIFISQDKYVAKILRKLGLTDGKSASTPMDTEKPLLKDPDGENAYFTAVSSKVSAVWSDKLTSVAVKKVNDITRLQALVDKKKMIITEATIRDDLRLADVKGIECLPNEEIFAELARMGYEKPSTKLTFYKAFFSPQWKFLIHTILQCMSAKRTSWNEFSSS